MYEKEKMEVIRASQIMYRSGMINMFEGNASVRVGDTIVITPSQQSKEDLTTDRIIEIDMNGEVQNPACGMKPSSEVGMHIALYQMRPDIRAIVHNHSAYATAFAMAGKPIVSTAHPELNFLFGQIPLAPYGTPGTDRIYKGIEPLIRDYNVVLLENHGVLAVGTDMTTALSRAEATEKIAKTVLLTTLLGGEKPLPEKELQMMRIGGQQKRHKDMNVE